MGAVLKAVTTAVLLSCLCVPSFADPLNPVGDNFPQFPEQGSFEKLADCIHLSENGRHNQGEAYGIHSVHYSSEREARQICLRTIHTKYNLWLKTDRKKPFLTFLASKYCPKNSKVWLKNVSYFMEVSNDN